MANPFPPDLRGYVHGFGHQPKDSIVRYGKSLSAGLGEILSMDLLRVAAGAEPLRRGGCTRTLQRVQECRAKPCHQTLVVAPLWLEVLCVLRNLEYKLSRKDYLHIHAFPDLVVVEQEEYPHALQRKATEGVTTEVVRETAGWTRPGLTHGTSTPAFTRPSWQQSYIAMSCGNIARVESLDVTLDDQAGLCRWVLMDGRM